MRVSGSSLNLGMTEQPADHRQRLPERQRLAGVAVARVVDAHVLQPGALADDLPRVVQVPHRLALDLARDHERVAIHARDRRQHACRLRRQRNRPGTRLGIGQPELVRLQVHLVPEQIENFALAASGQQQEPDRRHRMDRAALAGLRLVKHPAQPPELLLRQEPVARAFAELHLQPARVVRRFSSSEQNRRV